MATRISKAQTPVNCPRCRSVQLFAVKHEFWEKGGVEFFSSFTECSMCKDRTEIYKGTLEMMNLTKRKEKLTRMQRRGRTVGAWANEEYRVPAQNVSSEDLDQLDQLEDDTQH